MKIGHKPLLLVLLIAASISCSETPSSDFPYDDELNLFSPTSRLSSVLRLQPSPSSRYESPIFGVVPATPNEDIRDEASSGISSPASRPASQTVPGTPNTPYTPDLYDEIRAEIDAELVRELAADTLERAAADAAAAMEQLEQHPYRLNPFRTH